MEGAWRRENIKRGTLKEMIGEKLPELQDYLEEKIRTIFIFFKLLVFFYFSSMNIHFSQRKILNIKSEKNK